MKALAALALTTAAIVAVPTPASAMRVALYRLGGAVVAPGSLENPGTYALGYGFNVGVTLPFMHRIGATLDVGYDRLNWESGSEITIGSATMTRDDLTITSVMLGADVAFRRGNQARPLITAQLGIAHIAPGDAEMTDLFSGNRTTIGAESETVFAMSLGAGVRIRAPSWPAVRMTIGWTGLAREEFAHVVPLRFQVEF